MIDPPIVVRAEDGAQLVDLTLAVDAGTVRQTPAQSGLAALCAETVLRTRVDGVPLVDRVAAAGGAIDYTVGPSAVRFAIDALPEALPGIGRAVAAALAAPDTAPATFDAARAALGRRIAESERNPLVVGMELLRASAYARGGGSPALGDGVGLASLRPADVAAFVAAGYRRDGAVLVALGRVDGGARSAAEAIRAALPAGAPVPAPLVLRPTTAAGKQIVTHRDVGVPVMLAGYPAPALGESDLAAMLVVRALLERVGRRRTVATVEPFEQGAAAIYDYDLKPATIAVAFNGGLIDPDTGVTALAALVRDLTARPLAETDVRRLRESARGGWALEALALSDRAWLIAAAVRAGAAPDTPVATAAAIDRVTGADLQRIARRYLQRSTIAMVLPRTRS